MSSDTNTYQIGTTVMLKAVYKDENDNGIDPDALPVIEIHDRAKNAIQSGLIASKMAVGSYQYPYKTGPLKAGTYYHKWTAIFSGNPTVKSRYFILKDVGT